jgi:hypothetical protein
VAVALLLVASLVGITTLAYGDADTEPYFYPYAERQTLDEFLSGVEYARIVEQYRQAAALKQIAAYFEILEERQQQPVPVVSAVHPRVQGSLSALVCQPQYGWNCAWALSTVMCESTGSPTAINGPYIGLFQIDVDLHRWTYDQLVDPYTNTAAAHELWLRRGRAPWPACGYQ